jgi:F-type H+-transporting ATPase subunit epsilon
MAETFRLEIATPAQLVVDEAVSSAEIPGSNGYLGVLPGHAPLLGGLEPGVLTYTLDGKQHILVIEGGFLEILDDHVSVLAERTETAEGISLDSAKQELAAAEQALAHPPENAGYEAVLAAVRLMRLSQARVDAALRVRS